VRPQVGQHYLAGRHLGERLSGRAEQGQAPSAGPHPDNWPERHAAGVHADQSGQLTWHRPPVLAGRQPDLAAGIGAQRQLQVPSGWRARWSACERERATAPMGVVDGVSHDGDADAAGGARSGIAVNKPAPPPACGLRMRRIAEFAISQVQPQLC
jgi:hypothetical protein